MLSVRLAELAEVRGLQLAVLRPDGPLPGDGPAPADAVHVGAFDDGQPIGATTIGAAPWPGPGDLPAPTWRLRSMAVRADHRGTGVGLRVLDLAVQTAEDHGAATLWAMARVSSLGFYTKAGWAVVGQPWVKPGAGPHRWVFTPTGSSAPR